jgi:hypothetical protein
MKMLSGGDGRPDVAGIPVADRSRDRRVVIAPA